MSDPSSAPNSDEQVLAHFVQELEQADDRDAVLRKYRTAHPRLAGEIDGMAAMIQKVDHARPERDDPVPEQLGGFLLGKRVAAGGMGEVFDAVEERLQRQPLPTMIGGRAILLTHCSIL